MMLTDLRMNMGIESMQLSWMVKLLFIGMLLVGIVIDFINEEACKIFD